MYDIPNYQIGQFHCFHFIGSKLTNINCACFRYTMSCFGMHIHCEITTTTLLVNTSIISQLLSSMCVCVCVCVLRALKIYSLGKLQHTVCNAVLVTTANML